MGTSRALSVVPDDAVNEGLPDGVHMSVLQAAESDNRLEELRAMRRVIARHVDSTDTLARDLAALTRRQMEISREIDLLKNASEGDELGEAADTEDEAFNPQAV